MIGRLQPRRIVALARRDIGGPVDVVNLIHPASIESYRWYGVLVAPALRLVGAGPRWMGRLDEALVGEPQAEKLLLVRYPSHRRFLAMTLNPYYIAINRLREAGVRRFEASFTRASHTEDSLSGERALVGVHFRGGSLADVRAAFEPAAGPLVYATSAVASLDIFSRPAPTDPKPLTFGSLAMFRGELGKGEAEKLAAPFDCAVANYRSEPRSAYIPTALRRGRRR